MLISVCLSVYLSIIKLKLSDAVLHFGYLEILLSRKPVTFLFLKNDFYVKNLYRSHETKSVAVG